MTIGDRLREERDRLGLSQPKLAAIAGTTKQTLFSWETGKTAPDGFQLSALGGAGVDLLYVLTGQRSGSALSPEEQTVLSFYRSASKEVQRAALGALIGANAPAQAPSQLNQMGDLTMNNHAVGAVQIGFAAEGAVKRVKTRN